jgi:hypothetical protein
MKITNSIFVVFLTTVVRGFAPKVLFVRDTKRKNFEMIDAFLEMENSVNPKWLIHNIDHLSFTPLNISNAEPASSYSRITSPPETSNSNLIVANMQREVYFTSSMMKIGNSIRKKAPHFAKLIRSKNILPTLNNLLENREMALEDGKTMQ